MHKEVKVKLDMNQIDDMVRDILISDYNFMLANKHTSLYTKEEVSVYKPAFLALIEYYGGEKALKEVQKENQ